MEFNNENNIDTIEIDLMTVIKAFLSRIKLIVAIVIIFALITTLISVFIQQKKYTASVRFYVSNNKDVISQNLDSSDIDASTKLVPTYAELLKSKAVIADVIDETKLKCSVDQLMAMINVNMITDTQMLVLNVTANNPDDAFIIANAVADIAPEKITEIMNGSVIKIVDYADKPTSQSSPNVLKNIIFGIMLGLIFSFILIILLEISDSTIKSEDDIRDMFPNIPIIGIIPNISAENTELVRGK